MKKLFVTALCLLPASLYAAPSLSLGQAALYQPGFTHFGYVNPSAPKGGTLVLPAYGGFDSLNPYTLKGDAADGIDMLTVDKLMVQGEDEPFAVYGLLAESITVSPDERSVIFKLNPNARFHNGDPVLAKDVKTSFETLTRDEAAPPMFRLYWADVAGVDELDERTVRFRLKQRNAELPLSIGQLPVFSHKSYPKGLAAAPNTPPIGSGPYKLGKSEVGRSIEFKRDAAYWAQNLPTRKGMFNFDTVRFLYYRDNAVRVEGIKAGLYDFVEENTSRDWARAYPEAVLEKRHLQKHEWQHNNVMGMQAFIMNQRRPFFKDVRVRRAMVLSFDFESLNQRLFYGSYKRSNSFFTNSEMAATGKPQGQELAILAPLRAKLPEAVFKYDVPQPPKINIQTGIRPNLLQARALLLAAGYRYQQGALVGADGKPVRLEYLTHAKTLEKTVVKWQRDLAKIGITLSIRVVDAALYQRRVNNYDYDIITGAYTNGASPGNEQFSYHSCQAAKTPGEHNYSGICDAGVEELLKRFSSFRDRADLVASARAFDRVLRWQYLVVPNWYVDKKRVIYRDTLATPQRPPKYYSATLWALQTWWEKK
ncbi:MAG: extracellular solute-binding protein [Neisseria sp.]|uniref:extracellular solute-binding protein n=1 Tax=Neisseria sp. TaxID=192066 RepID=UPI0026DBDC1E|nr:extracellular solute-binding protein [Neisseria sp.]MDO4641803.1 extracellular solute-binding protein [Neisseria sp.]